MDKTSTNNPLYEKYYFLSIRYLSYRDRSEKEMRDYLKKKEAPLDVADLVIESLIRNKFVNDEHFAKVWTRSRLVGRPKSKRVITMELKQKGISQDIIEQVFLDKELSIDDLQMARQLAQKQMRKYHGLDKNELYQKLGGFLGRRGFDFSTIRRVIDEVIEKRV